MPELPDQWAMYVRYQAKLDIRLQVDGDSWGLEAGMNRLLEKLDQIPSEEEVDRDVQNESRKERHRAALRRAHLSLVDSTGNVEDALNAQHQLQAVREQVTEKDWGLLHAIGVGHDYEELALAHGATVGSLRVRVLRIRRGLRIWQRGSASDASESETCLPVAA